MIGSMDLNASPEPEPEKDDVFLASTSECPRRERAERMRRYQPNTGSSRLPPGWLDCPAYGHDIAGFLIPSKVPLGESFNQEIPPGKRYSSKQVLNQPKFSNRKIGLVIDLTNSDRYYKVKDWSDEGIKHVKIKCTGRDSVPNNEGVNKFVYEVQQFLASQRQPNRHILVHCTHGHNRTGYMIAHFLVRAMPAMSVTQAIRTFSEARPPGIYKPDYIDALYDFYHEKKPELVVCPPTPEWKRSSDDDDGDEGPTAPPDETNETLTNDDLLGDEIPSDQAQVMRQFVYQALKMMPKRDRGSPQFPGSHPVSLDRENLQLLRQRYYYATWKADGTRYMMLITMCGCYLIDRHFNFRRVQMRFPCRHTNERGGAEKSYHRFTLLDGEMVIDTMPDTNKQERRYLIYDMMVYNQESLVERPFHERWKLVEKEIIQPRNFERQHIHKSQNPYYRYELEPFRVRRKDFWVLSTVAKLLKGFIPNLSHNADGLIFQGWDDPYVKLTHKGLLKWKYHEMNSVDFLFEMVESRQLLYLYKHGEKKLMDDRVVFPDDGPAASVYNGKIIECSWNSKEKVWVCMRVRVDKGTPNDIRTYTNVMKSITDNITEDVLLNAISEIIRLPMYSDRIQSESQGHNASRRR
ncbi:mRNA guanylyltransferase [Salvia divinorum]|uniref:mRNA guanylyltransferase n=1 Tax=Salvia divinorum TaxID=28513 RepID=A0ABD1H3A2_SALDI